MKVIINTASTYKGGGVQVAQSFIEECKAIQDHEYHIVLGETMANLITTDNYPSNFFFYKIGYRPGTRVLHYKSSDEFFKKLEKKINPDVVFTTSGPAYWRPEAPHVVGYNLPHYVYGDSPFWEQVPFLKRLKWKLKGKMITRFFKKEADAYVVQTDDVNDRLRQLVDSDQVFTVSNTYGQQYEDPESLSHKLPPKPSDEYRFLSLSTWHAHKNLDIIPEIIAELPLVFRKSVRFVLTLPEQEFKEHFPGINNSNIINVGPINPKEGPSLYAECDALFLPTLLECFSATYAEAMKMNKPILTSDLGFAHTVCGDAALYANPMSPKEWAARIMQLVVDEDLARSLVENGRKQQSKFLSASERAQKYLEICQNVIEEQPKRDRKIVVVNQAVNYLTIGLCNAFTEEFGHVDLITGSIHEQGESLNKSIGITKINQWIDRPAWKKLASYLWACMQVYVLLLTHYRKYDVIFVSLPPMGYLMSIFLPNRCSMLIWDVYPDVFKITGMEESHPIFKSWAWLNRKAFNRAYRVYTIGVKMAELLAKYVSRDKIYITPIWSIFQSNERVQKSQNPFVWRQNLGKKFVVQYSGNIGLTHNVEVVVELAELMKDHDDILFQIIGRGPRVPHLKRLVKEKDLPNCQFLPFQSDEMFPYSLSAADIGVVILNDATSKGSVPSKSYNLMSYGIPALYIASRDSELHHYATKYNHAKCISSDNLKAARAFILKLKSDKKARKKYSQNAVSASENYRRSNADKIVKHYLA